ncbi:hypothetical protein D3C72_1975730 [compost metagenome]
MRGHGLLGLRQRAIDHPYVSQQLCPRRRRPRSASHALHQLQPEAPFKLPDLQADRRLRHPAPFGGGGKTAQFDDLRKRAQMVQVQPAHRVHPKFCL